MAEYKLSNTVDKDKVFIVKRSGVDERLDPIYFSFKRNIISKFKYPTEKIGKHFIIKDGDHDKLPDGVLTNKEEGKRYLRAQDLKDFKILEDNPVYVNDEYFNKIKRCQIFPGDLLISIMASIGLNVIVPNGFDICVANRAIGILRTKTNSKINPQYLQILINTNIGFSLFDIEKKGGIQQRLNLSDIGNVKIPTPPKEIQEQIISNFQFSYIQKQQKEAEAKQLLDSIDAYLLGELGITLPEKNDSLQSRIFTTKFKEITGGRLDPFSNQKYYDVVFDSIKNSKFTSVRLKDVISFIESGSRPSGGVSNIESGILSLGGEHVNTTCEIEIKTPKYIPIEYHYKIIQTETRLFDILLVKDGATTGKIGILEKHEHVGQNINEHVFIIRVNEQINPHYLAYILHSVILQVQIKKGITGATVTGLTKDVVKNLRIPLPPLEKQNEIAKHIQGIRDKAKQLQEEAVAILDQAKKEVEQRILGA